jgi:hypothetical protein
MFWNTTRWSNCGGSLRVFVELKWALEESGRDLEFVVAEGGGGMRSCEWGRGAGCCDGRAQSRRTRTRDKFPQMFLLTPISACFFPFCWINYDASLPVIFIFLNRVCCYWDFRQGVLYKLMFLVLAIGRPDWNIVMRGWSLVSERFSCTEFFFRMSCLEQIHYWFNF